MEFSVEKTGVHLQGDMTLNGVTYRCIESLTDFLWQLESLGEKFIQIDCGRVSRADICGLQLLYVWMQCARFRGVESELVNLPAFLRTVMQGVGLGNCFQVSTSFRSMGLTLLPAG